MTPSGRTLAFPKRGWFAGALVVVVFATCGRCEAACRHPSLDPDLLLSRLNEDSGSAAAPFSSTSRNDAMLVAELLPLRCDDVPGNVPAASAAKSAMAPATTPMTTDVRGVWYRVPSEFFRSHAIASFDPPPPRVV